MPVVLAFGDSLTFGANPAQPGRHAKADRWPEVVAKETGFEVISEGLRGRTTAFDQDTSPGNLNGVALLPSMLHSHAPVDLLAIMLGTNDCVFGYGPLQACFGLSRLIELARFHPFRSAPQAPPEILLMAPPPMVQSDDGFVSAEMIDQSQALVGMIKAVAEKEGVAFFDTSSVAQASPIDGIHLDAANTRAIGAAVAPLMVDILSDR